MKKQRELIERMQELFAPPVQVFTAKVTKVDAAKHTVDAIDANEVEYFNVRLKAAINTSTDCVVLIPEVDSDILIGLIGNSDNALYMTQATKLSGIKGKIGETTFDITNDGFVLDGGDNGGVFISENLVDDINGIKQDLNNLKTIISTWVPATGDGGTALKTATATWAAQSIEETALADVINNRVKH